VIRHWRWRSLTCVAKRHGGLGRGDTFTLLGRESLCRLKPMGGTGMKQGRKGWSGVTPREVENT